MSRVPGTTDTWQATISRPPGTIIDYVFERNGDIGGKREAYVPIGSSNPQIYRKLLITDGATVNEIVAQWIDLPPPADISTGTLTGRVTDQAGNPLAGIWVSAGPHQTSHGHRWKFHHLWCAGRSVHHHRAIREWRVRRCKRSDNDRAERRRRSERGAQGRCNVDGDIPCDGSVDYAAGRGAASVWRYLPARHGPDSRRTASRTRRA